jgi:hypothetical protein
MKIQTGYLIRIDEGVATVVTARKSGPSWWELSLKFEDDGRFDLLTRHEDTIEVLKINVV